MNLPQLVEKVSGETHGTAGDPLTRRDVCRVTCAVIRNLKRLPEHELNSLMCADVDAYEDAMGTTDDLGPV